MKKLLNGMGKLKLILMEEVVGKELIVSALHNWPLQKKKYE